MDLYDLLIQFIIIIVIPIFLLLFYEILAALLRVSWLNYQNPFNFKDYYNLDKTRNVANTYLDYITDLKESFFKVFLQDIIGNVFNFFNKTPNTLGKTHFGINLLTISSTLTFFALLISALAFNKNIPFLSNYNWIVVTVALLFGVRIILPIIYNLAERFLMYLDFVSIKNSNATDGSYTELSMLDLLQTTKHEDCGNECQQINHKAFTKAIENFKDLYDTRNVFNIYPKDYIRKLCWFVATNLEAPRYFIYLLIFAYLLNNIIKVTTFPINDEENEDEKDEEDETMLSSINDKRKKIFFNMFKNLFLISLISFIGVCAVVTFLFIGNFVFKTIFKNIINAFLEDKETLPPWKQELIFLISLFGFGKYPNITNETEIQKVEDFKFLEYFKSFTIKCIIPITFATILSFVFSMTFICYYESDPQRYKENKENKENNLNKRFNVYINCYKAFTIALAFIVGLMSVIGITDLYFKTITLSIILAILIGVVYFLFY